MGLSHIVEVWPHTLKALMDQRFRWLALTHLLNIKSVRLRERGAANCVGSWAPTSQGPRPFPRPGSCHPISLDQKIRHRFGQNLTTSREKGERAPRSRRFRQWVPVCLSLSPSADRFGSQQSSNTPVRSAILTRVWGHSCGHPSKAFPYCGEWRGSSEGLLTACQWQHLVWHHGRCQGSREPRQKTGVCVIF